MQYHMILQSYYTNLAHFFILAYLGSMHNLNAHFSSIFFDVQIKRSGSLPQGIKGSAYIQTHDFKYCRP